MIDNEPVLSGAIVTFLVALVTLLTTSNIVTLTQDQIILITSVITSTTHLVMSLLSRSVVVPVSKLDKG